MPVLNLYVVHLSDLAVSILAVILGKCIPGKCILGTCIKRKQGTCETPAAALLRESPGGANFTT
jgi:hypothetical protein